MQNPSEIVNPADLALPMHALALLRPLLEDELVSALLAVLDDAMGAVSPCAETVEHYCHFAAVLYRAGGNLGEALKQRVMHSENPAVRLKAQGKPLPASMAATLDRELELFSKLSGIGPDLLAPKVRKNLPMPGYETTWFDMAALYKTRLEESPRCGYGVFASWHMFTVGEGTALLPVKNPDPQRLAELTGYEAERQQILLNTRALLQGLPANNVLLYGDAGTGKSSTVKAIANEYRSEGLRLIELRKNQLYQIPMLMDTLAENPLKFVLFIDDLSFPADDGDFTALKAILEGNISARPHNIVVYATSNRRHIMRQNFSSRVGDDINLGDTLEEESSLSARFGLTITYLKPDRELYAQIVTGLAKEYGVETPLPVLLEKAEAHAIRQGGRSPRTARQFVEFTKAAEAAGQ